MIFTLSPWVTYLISKRGPVPIESKELLCHLTGGFLFLSTSAPSNFISPFEITEQFAPLSIIAEGTCTIFPNGEHVG